MRSDDASRWESQSIMLMPCILVVSCMHSCLTCVIVLACLQSARQLPRLAQLVIVYTCTTGHLY
jgi:hypothetical protein